MQRQSRKLRHHSWSGMSTFRKVCDDINIGTRIKKLTLSKIGRFVCAKRISWTFGTRQPAPIISTWPICQSPGYSSTALSAESAHERCTLWRPEAVKFAASRTSSTGLVTRASNGFDFSSNSALINSTTGHSWKSLALGTILSRQKPTSLWKHGNHNHRWTIRCSDGLLCWQRERPTS